MLSNKESFIKVDKIDGPGDYRFAKNPNENPSPYSLTCLRYFTEWTILSEVRYRYNLEDYLERNNFFFQGIGTVARLLPGRGHVSIFKQSFFKLFNEYTMVQSPQPLIGQEIIDEGKHIDIVRCEDTGMPETDSEWLLFSGNADGRDGVFQFELSTAKQPSIGGWGVRLQVEGSNPGTLIRACIEQINYIKSLYNLPLWKGPLPEDSCSTLDT